MNIKERLAKISFLPVRPDLSGLKDNERRALAHCVRASTIVTDIYLRQVFADNPLIYKELLKRGDEEGVDLARYFKVHGSPWDSFDNETPFISGIGEREKFGSFYPNGFTKEEYNAWLTSHPEDRPLFESPYTVIERRGDSLVAIPYSEAYASFLNEAAEELRAAADELPAGKLRSFLELRAAAFLSNDYFESDMAWVDTDGDPFEVTIGPYETYFDKLLGIRASFEAFVGVPDKDATAALQKYTPVVPDFDRILSKEFAFKPKGAAIPLEVIDDVVRGGEAIFGYFFVAYNLPNDRRVHDLKGSKKVFSRTMMQAKFDALIRPVAERTLSARDFKCCKFSNRFLFVLGHELSHGLGPSMVKIDGREMPFEVALGDLGSCIEEAKADMLGARLLGYFRERGLLDDETLRGCIVSEIATYASSWRQGYTEAHARGHLVQYNWLKDRGAVTYNASEKVFEIDAERAFEAMTLLSTEFLKLEVAGDYNRAKAFMDSWSVVPPEIPAILERLADIPLAVYPVYDAQDL
ncbi:MAG: hypothetical protein Q8P49_03075 [Candidatus Liptonbacteria bacterium]|nr:hypothetical protein [Candidatus Liptonbacteria bacterium]